MTKQRLFETILALESPVNVTFSHQLKLIKDPTKRSKIENMLRQVHTDNINKPASSSGKYHPQFAHDEKGLSRHTKAVVSFAADICEAFPVLDYDTMIIAALMHDIMKYTGGAHTSKSHAKDASEWLAKEGLKDEARLTLKHMGRWDGANEPKEFDERMLHLADYLASRQWISVDFDENDNIIYAKDDTRRSYNKVKDLDSELAATKYDRDFLLGKNDGF